MSPVKKTKRGYEFFWEVDVTVSGFYGGEMEALTEICLSEADLLEMLDEIKKAKEE